MREKYHHKILAEETQSAFELGKAAGRAELIAELLELLDLEKFIKEVISNDIEERKEYE